MKNTKPVRKTFFTLIELIISIVVIGILVAIIIPNVGGLKTESTTAAMQGNIKNLETAVTMYSLEHHGEYPTPTIPTIGQPQSLLFEKIHPDHIRSLPKIEDMKYWVDYSGAVWASSADSPLGVFYGTTGKLTWEQVENAESYSVFKVSDSKTKSAANKQEITFIQHTEELEVDLPEPKEGETYLVSSTDKFSLESPPASSEYQGYILPGQVLGELAPGDSQKEPFPWPLNKEQPTWKNSDPELRDGDDNTYIRRGNEDYIIEWNGDMANRVIQLDFKPYSSSPTGKKTIEFIDEEGKSVPFINAKTDEPYLSYNMALNTPRTAIDFVVPRGAVKLLIHGPLIIDLFKADFVKDLSLPQPVSNVQSTATSESITLTWDKPNGENFLKTAIYSGDKFIGYGENGIFTHKPLYSNMEYSYFIEPVSVVGNRGQRVYHTNKTKAKEINWRGLSSAAAFDSSPTTFTSDKAGAEVSWDGDLANRQINIQHRINSSYSGDDFQIAFYNADNQIVASKLANSNVATQTHSIRSMKNSTTTTSIVVPENAIKFRIVEVDYGNTMYFYDISYGNTLELPSKLTNVTTEATTEEVTFTFNKPNDVVRLSIWRDGEFLAYISSDSYIDKSLHSGKTYQYTFETFNTAGHRTKTGGATTVTTDRTEIVWKGLNSGEAFDSSLTTFSSDKIGAEVSWEGDLTNRQINIQHRVDSNYNGESFQIAFYNDNNQVVASKLANNNILTQIHTLRSLKNSTTTTSLIVPEGATKFRLVDVNYSKTMYFYDISYGDTLELPSKLTNVTAEATTEAVTLTFNKPNDVARVSVWRDGEFLAYTNSDSYTDMSLHSDRTYQYTFETFNVAGHQTTTGGSVKATTKRTEIVWRGLNSGAAFDSSLITYSTDKKGAEVSWEGDLTNRQINIQHRIDSTWSGDNFQIAFYNANNQIVASKLVSSGVVAQTHSVRSLKGSTVTTSFIVPEGANKFRIVDVAYSKAMYFYDISYN